MPFSTRPRLQKLSGSTCFAAGSFALLLLLYLRPYYGIRHDAVLYLGQALSHLDPKNFADDIFFVFGGQTNFTAFPQLIGELLKHFDAANIFLILTGFALVLFLIGSAALLRTIFPTPQWYWSLLALLIFPPYYGGLSIISYAEPFLTGRSLAEPLALLGLAVYFSNRHVFAVVLAALAAILHPLQATAVFVVIWIDLALRDRRWLFLLLIPPTLFLLAATGVPIAEKITLRYDDEWYSWFSGPNGFVHLRKWPLQDWAVIATDVFIVALVLQNSRGTLRRFATSVLLATIVGLTSSFILSDLFRFVLPTSIQLWRIHWLFHWLAMASIPYVIIREYTKQPTSSGRFYLLLITIAVGISSVGISPNSAGNPSQAVWLLIPLYYFWPKFSARVGRNFPFLLGGAFIIILFILVGKHIAMALLRYDQAEGLREIIRPEFVILSNPLLGAVLVTAFVWAFNFSPHIKKLLLLLLIPALAYSSLAWDRRSGWTRYIESAEYNPLLFGIQFEPKAQVYWANELAAPWLILRRPSYFNSQQMGGMLFNRETAREAFTRYESLRLVEFQLSTCRLMNELNKSETSCWLDKGAIVEVCNRAKGGLDYLILDNDLKENSIGSWSIKGRLNGNRPITYHVYRCQDFLTD